MQNIDLTKFKPDLIANNKKNNPNYKSDLEKTILKNGGITEYQITFKKDGCRMQVLPNKLVTRALKEVKSKLVQNRFASIVEMCNELKITLDSEFFSPDLKFNQIFSYFSNFDVTSEAYKLKLIKEYNKDKEAFNKYYENRTIKELTTFLSSLKMYVFDGLVLDRPDLVGYTERVKEIQNRINKYSLGNEAILNQLVLPTFHYAKNFDELYALYDSALNQGFEGLVLTHNEHKYKFGRNTLNKGSILKMKDDNKIYDGIVLDVVEGDVIKEGVVRTTNELGMSTTSKKKADREPSGQAKGFEVLYEGKVFIVSLKGFNDTEKQYLLKNKEQFIGKHFIYTAMPPTKDVPRSAFFKCWRDEK